MLYQLSYMGSTSADPNTADSALERVMGIEPTSSAWKAEVLPLNYTRADGAQSAGRTSRARVDPRTEMVEGEGFEPSKA